MCSSPFLKVDWCSRDAAKLACERWHYSKCLPVGRLVTVGAWEGTKFIGAVIFGHGANHNIGAPYGLEQSECVELVRVALTTHLNPVSKVGSIAVRFLKKQSPGLRLLVSYADTGQGHHGGIYQAMNWVYVGISKGEDEIFFKGAWRHKKTVCDIRGSAAGLPTRKKSDKHVYLYPLDDEIRSNVVLLSKPYPKRAPCGVTSDSAGPAPTGQGGASPTTPLQSFPSMLSQVEG